MCVFSWYVHMLTWELLNEQNKDEDTRKKEA